ncbi:MAG TPA: 5-formyltetrahydrofolate cyclo-ligase [Kofleriaceae bacterium]|nr:5-formyltetrahydrofolate cyclo-ligase [Kofleriaceae bacterium]
MQPPDLRGPRGKSATRHALLALRDAMTAEERAAASGVIGDAANALLATRLLRSGVLALYSAKGSEVETERIDAFARARGLVVAYPRVVDRKRTLAFHAVALDELAPSRFGLREPSVDAPAVALEDIAVFMTPGLAFDRSGGRIGWGRGHYDATFAAASPGALRVGLAFECQLIDHVPREPHDALLHTIITEVATYAVA